VTSIMMAGRVTASWEGPNHASRVALSSIDRICEGTHGFCLPEADYARRRLDVITRK
jgi:hypothetical protein